MSYTNEAKQTGIQNDIANGIDEQKLEVVIPATKETLEKVKYQDLRETFTILGIPNVWKPGSKASKMIANALEKLGVIRSLESKGLQGDELKKAVDVKNAENEEAVQTKQKEQDDQKIEVKAQTQNDYKKSIVAMGLDEGQLEKAIENIDANLRVGIATHREILLSKREVLLTILSELGNQK